MSDMMQSLENRKLLSSTLTDGLLTVTGTGKRDFIVVSLSRDGETVTVTERSGTRFRRGAATTADYSADEVSSVLIDGVGGNDRLIVWGRGDSFAVPATINGGSGDDVLSGGNGNDLLNAGDGDDDVYGNGGNDVLNGDAGDDKLEDRSGVDTLNGGDGDDLLIAYDLDDDDDADLLDGGSDTAEEGEDDGDIAIVDEIDTVTLATIQEDTPFADTPIGAPAGPGGHRGPGGHGGPGGPRGGTGGGDDGDDTATTRR
jgi:Ca2+-binding RTX toxin-like protein